MQAPIYPFDRPARPRYFAPHRQFGNALPGRISPPDYGRMLGGRIPILAARGRSPAPLHPFRDPLPPLRDLPMDLAPPVFSPKDIGPLRHRHSPLFNDPYIDPYALRDRLLNLPVPLLPRHPAPLLPYNRHQPHDSYLFDRGHCIECYGKDCHEHCPSSCKAKEESSKLSFQTKDVTIRGKSYAIRRAFLEDNSKFEKEIVSYIDKKDETTIPTAVIGHLVDMINDESIKPNSILDLVTLNILASSVGVKSAVKSSQALLDKYTYENPPHGRELTDIVASILLSTKVDEGLTEWLKKYVKAGAYEELERSRSLRDLLYDHPEVLVSLESLMGTRQKPDNDGLRIQ